MNRRLFSLSCAIALLAGCQQIPETYAPPVQRPTFENVKPYRDSRIVDMSDGDLDAHIVRDLVPGGNGWRWAGQHPAVRVVLRSVGEAVYSADFSIADATFKTTGPVTLTFEVNGHELGSGHYTAPGVYHFEKAVPNEWIEAGKDTTLSISIDKVWVSPDDGAKLGFILSRIGLRQANR